MFMSIDLTWQREDQFRNFPQRAKQIFGTVSLSAKTLKNIPFPKVLLLSRHCSISAKSGFAARITYPSLSTRRVVEDEQ